MQAEEKRNQRWEGCFLLRVLSVRVEALVRCYNPFGGTPTFIKHLGSEK